MTDKYFSWNEGLPTKPDVDMLLNTWQSPKIGDRFEYEMIAKIIGCESTSVRFKTVTSAWRKRLHKCGLNVECDKAKAFYVANFDQTVSATYGVLKFIGHKAHRHRAKLANAEPADQLGREVKEHHGRLMISIEKDTKKSVMNILPSTPTPQLPRLTVPAKAIRNEEPK